MARGNRIILHGMVTEPPRISIDDESGDYVFGLATLKVIRGARNAQDGKKYATFAYPRIYTKSPGMIKLLETWDQNDIVEVQGAFHQTTINKQCTCPECGALNIRSGDFGYIEPTFLNVIEHFDDEDEAKKDLRRYILVSNQANVAGNLGRNPRRLTLKSKVKKDAENKARVVVVCEYPLIVHRLLFVEEDPPEKKEDMIWVKSYGQKNVDNDYFRLLTGSEVMIDGFLQTRSIGKETVCDSCGEPFKWSGVTMEIVPYETEYNKNYRSKEEAEKLMKERQEQATRDILENLRKRLGSDAVNDSEISENELNEDSGLLDDLLKDRKKELENQEEDDTVSA